MLMLPNSEMTTGASVAFKNVSKTYDGERSVVADLSMTIPPGQFMTLLGPSGSGKTTTLMMLAGFEAPTSGNIWMDGHALTNVPPHRRNIGMVFQDYALFPHMTVLENVCYPLRARGVGRSDARIRAIKSLDMVELGAFAGRYPHQLSGGQRQRVALSRALVFEPKLVLLDEPLGALDKQLRERMQLEIRQLQSRLGVTMVSVTHDQSEALTMSDRVAIFADGCVQQLATPFDLYENPANAFVASFVGESNLFNGTVERVESGQAALRTSTGDLFVGRCGDSVEVGEQLSYLVRPERVRIASVESDNENTAEIVVKEIVYLGDHLKIHASIGLNESISIKIPVSDLESNICNGEKLHVCWSRDHGRILK